MVSVLIPSFVNLSMCPRSADDRPSRIVACVIECYCMIWSTSTKNANMDLPVSTDW